jgi:6-pyruvoyltetrahydropterin/6-carboxytetrahydropterin synthase
VRPNSVVTLRKLVRIEAAHCIANHPGKCARPHGHSYVIEVFIKGRVDQETGMVKDFYEIKEDCNQVIEVCDHRDLNEMFPDMLTTAENLALYFLGELRVRDWRYICVRVHETATGYAEASALELK